MPRTYVEILLAGEVLDIDDFVDTWHRSVDDTRTLQDALGITSFDYSEWVKDASHFEILIRDIHITRNGLIL